MLKLAVIALTLLSAGAQATAQIIIAQTAAFTGGPAPSVIEMTAGAKLIIDAENAKGGIRGQRIELIALDDGFDAKRAAANTSTLIEKHEPVAMFLSRGTPTAEAMLPVLKKHGVPLIAPSTGAMILRSPVQPLVFNVRASYQGEARKTVEQIFGMGFQRIGIIYVDDSFGRDALTGVIQGFDKINTQSRTGSVKPVFVEKYDRDSKDFTKIIDRANTERPPALLLIGATGPTIAILQGLERFGMRSYVATLSTNASDGFLKSVGPAGRSVIVSQVFPSERATAIPLVREVTTLAKAAKGVKQDEVDGPLGQVSALLAKGIAPSPAMLEGAAAAKVLIAGLKRCAGKPTASKLVAALNGIGGIDVGWPGHEVKYSESDHSGIEYTDLSIVSGEGSGAAFRR